MTNATESANGWNWFDAAGEEPEAIRAKEIDHWQACFATPAGRQVLRDLERQFIQTSLGPASNNAALWMREGQRGLVLQMMRLAQAIDIGQTDKASNAGKQNSQETAV
ncbi:Bbp19 family protein [Thalassospira lucentensis]|uniref:Bbp19 family protein n=1 Tax=Thalassospira lucentensis TaxID=168935 RepID=UPI00158881E3|nr:hypothetical protein [Thalassospira lucentensis]